MTSFLDILEKDSKKNPALENLKQRIAIKQFKKGTVMQRPGDYVSNIYYVKKGLLRSYTIDEKGKEHIFMFAPEDWIIADGSTFLSPCQLFIDVLEDTEVEVVEQKMFEEEFIPLTQQLDQQHTYAMIKRMAVLQDRIIMLMSATAIQRYEHFVETYPQILQRVPQRMIASYLGITPEALSKVKNQRNKSR